MSATTQSEKVDIKTLQKEITNEFLSEMVSILPNSDIILQKAGIDVNVYLEMNKDPQIIAVSKKRKSYIQSYKYEIKAENKQIEEFIINVFNNLDVSKIIDGLFIGVQVGYAVLELIWGYDKNNKLVITDVKKRNPLRFKFTTNGDLVYQDIQGMEKIAPYGKFCILTYDSLDDSNKYGNSLNSSCFWYWTFKKKGWGYWLNSLQKYGLPPLVYKAMATDENDSEIKASQLSQVQSGASIVIDVDEEITPISIPTDKESFEKFIKIADEQIAKIYLGSPSLIENAKYGTYSNSQTQENGLENLVITDLKTIQNSIREYIIKPLVKLNFGNDSDIPQITFIKDDKNTSEENTKNNNSDNIKDNNKQTNNKKEAANIDNFKQDDYTIDETLPKHTVALEKLLNNLKIKQTPIYKNIFQYKTLDSEANKAVKDLKNKFDTYTQSLGKSVSYGLFYTYLLAKLENKRMTENFSIDKLLDIFSKNDLYDGAILPFDEAYKRFKKKIPLSSNEFDELVGQAKSEAYRIAGIESKKIVNATKIMLEDNFDNSREWKKQASEYLDKAGYSITGNHLDTVYRTNVFQAYSVAQWNEYQLVKKQFPALKYVTVGDNRVRPAHRELAGKVFMLDDPIWNRIYPPNGYRCRCTTIPLSKSKLKKVKVDDGNSKQWKDFRVDDGFNYNPAVNAREYQIATYGDKIKEKASYKNYGLNDINKSKLNKALLKENDIKVNKEYTDVLNGNILIPKGSTKKRELVKNILSSPAEVWLKSYENPNGSYTYKTYYIKSYLDTENNQAKNFIVVVDKYNQFEEILEINNPNIYRNGGLIYYENQGD